MTYTLNDDGFYDDPRYAELELEDFGLLTCMRSYSGKHLTDGEVPTAVIRRWGSPGRALRVARKLAARGLLREEGPAFVDVDYLEHNPSREEVEARRAAISEVRRKAGRAGGLRSGEARRKQPGSKLLEANEALSNPLHSDPIREEEAPAAPAPSPRDGSEIGEDEGFAIADEMAVKYGRPKPERNPKTRAAMREEIAWAKSAGWKTPFDALKACFDEHFKREDHFVAECKYALRLARQCRPERPPVKPGYHYPGKILRAPKTPPRDEPQMTPEQTAAEIEMVLAKLSAPRSDITQTTESAA